MKVDIKKFLINTLGKDLDLDTFDFAKDLPKLMPEIKPVVDFYNDEIEYNQVKIKNRKNFDSFYFINIRLLEIILENYSDLDLMRRIFDNVFLDLYFDREAIPDDAPIREYMFSILSSNAVVMDVYFNVSVYVDHIYAESQILIVPDRMVFSDIQFISLGINLTVLPSKVTFNFLKQIDALTGTNWYTEQFGIELSNIELD